MGEIFAVGIGGFIGSCMRFLITKLSGHISEVFPFGTLFSNVLAGLAIGFIIAAGQQTSITPRARLFLTTGMLGGLSTFSTFSIETVSLFGSGKYGVAALNILLNLALGISGVVLGIFLARLIFKKA